MEGAAAAAAAASGSTSLLGLSLGIAEAKLATLCESITLMEQGKPADSAASVLKELKALRLSLATNAVTKTEEHGATESAHSQLAGAVCPAVGTFRPPSPRPAACRWYQPPAPDSLLTLGARTCYAS